MVKTGTNTFDGGMNKDLADRLLPANKYRDSQNMRLITTKGGTTGNLENVRGNKFILDAVESSYIVDGKVIGSVELRDDIILFVVGSGGESRIYRLEIDLATELQSSLTLLYDDSLNIDDSKLGFSTAYPIKAIAKYETPNIQKVYWTDGYNNMRYANVASYLTVDGLPYTTPDNYMSADKFEYLPKFTFSKPTLKNIVGGKVNTGMVAYAYQLYIMNGAETAFSALSDPISVVSDSDFLSNTKDYKGDELVTNSGKGFVMEIDNTDNIGYNRLRLVRIQYSFINSIPEIYICNEIAIDPAGDTILVTDIGDVLGTLTVDEFNLVSTELFTCQDIASKDNRLFVSNIEKKDFIVDDWDARAVRFNAANLAVVYDSNYGSTILESDFSDWVDDYKVDHDGICSFNNPANDGGMAPYKFKADGVTLGAEGRNIAIDFETAPFELDSSNSHTEFYADAPTDGTDLSYNNYASPWKGGKLSWQRDEIYRLFVVFGNDRGQVADPKWICDLRMPSLHDDAFANTSGGGAINNPMILAYQLGGGTVRSYKLYPRIYFKSFPTNATWAQIHRVKRERTDRSVVTQGLIVPVTVDNTDRYQDLANAPNPALSYVMKMVSPEILSARNISQQPNDYLEYVTYYPDNDSYRDSTVNIVGGLERGIHKLHTNVQVNFSTNVISTINEVKPITPSSESQDNSYSLFGVIRHHNYYNGLFGTSKGCSGLDIEYNNINWLVEGSTFSIVNYRNYNDASRYGGNTYEDRMNNISIPCSDVITLDSSWHDISYGDTFINYFDVSTILVDLERTNWQDVIAESVYVPLESSINCDLMYENSSQHKTYDSGTASLRQEYKGIHVFNDGGNEIKYEQEYNLYSYNTVYSQQIDVKPAISLVVDKILETKFDTMIKSSNKKSNGEITDSWTKFGVNEFIEVDSIYGPVNSIFNFNNRVFYFQDKAFGLLSINDRSVIQDASTAKLVLGTGGILDRFDYISILCGSKDKFSVVGGDTGMFWYDRINNYLIKYADSIDKISISKGIQSYLNNSINTHIVIAHPDKNNNEILYTFYGGTLDPFTLAYSENIDAYTSFYSCIPNIYIPYKNRYLTTTGPTYCYDQFDMDYLFLHDSIAEDTRCMFYSLPGEDPYYYDSSLKILFNQDYNHTKTWDNISYINSVYDANGTELYDQTFNSVRCYNEYQNSDYVTLTYGTNINHRERSWTLAVPRNVVEDNITGDPNIFNSDLTNTTRLYRERLRDKYMITDFSYINDGTKDKFVLGNVSVRYRLSFR